MKKHADTNTCEDWLRRRALKVPAPRYLHISAPLQVVKDDAGLRRVVIAPKSMRRTFKRQPVKP